MLYVLAYVLTWVPYMGMCFYIMYTSNSLLLLTSATPQTAPISDMAEKILKNVRTWYYFTIFISMLTGLLMACVRIREPMFQRQLRIYWNQYWGELPPNTDKLTFQQEKSKVEGTLLSFLMSSLNIELVHIILHAVSMRTVGTAKSETRY